MNPLFSSDPVERILAMIAVRPPIPLPAWVRTPRPVPTMLPIVRLGWKEWRDLPRFHTRHEAAALAAASATHDRYIVGPVRFPVRDDDAPHVIEWHLLARVVCRGPACTRVVYRRIVPRTTLDDLAAHIERVRDNRRRASARAAA